MEFIKKLDKRIGENVGFIHSDIRPDDSQVCVGKEGLNKSLTLEQIITIAYKMDTRPNIIIKAGINAKWYLKYFPKEKIQIEVDKQKKFRDISRCTMWIIEWD
jgi:hypothetical protein